jgi:arginase
MIEIAILDAASNLGLRPPAPGVVPGCYKLAGALRDQRLLQRLGAVDAGALTPPRYLPDWESGMGPRNAEAIAHYSRQLAARVGMLLDRRQFPLVLGGDCSITLGPMLALKQRGRFGLAYLDAHTDFRHLGNAPSLQAVGGEDVAVCVGLGDSRLTALGDDNALLDIDRVAYLGVRDDAWFLDDVRTRGATIVTSADVVRLGAVGAAAEALAPLLRLDGFWIHLDCDVVDGALLPSVDSPEPNGLSFQALAQALRALVASGKAVGATVAIYDPDLDPDAHYAPLIADALISAFAPEVH